jgi:diacylglycerol kinase (ATP)
MTGMDTHRSAEKRLEPTSYLAIVNPAAGGGRSGKLAERSLDALRGRGVVLSDVVRTEAAGDARRFAESAWRKGTRSFLVVGGDGTAHETLNGALAAASPGEGPPRLAMLPLGTGNSFLRDVGIRDQGGALEAIARGLPRPVDVVRVHHAGGHVDSFNIASIGFTADVGARTNAKYKPLGAAGYVVAVFEKAIGLRGTPVTLRLDGGPPDTRPVILLSLSNSRCTAGAMQMAPRADFGDGELDVIRIGVMGRFRFVTAFPSIFAGEHVLRPGVEQTRAKRVDFDDPRELDWMIDGEILRLTVSNVEVLRHAMEVVA